MRGRRIKTRTPPLTRHRPRFDASEVSQQPAASTGVPIRLFGAFPRGLPSSLAELFRTRDPPVSRAGACASLRDRLRRPTLRASPCGACVSTTQVDSIVSCWLHDVRTLATRDLSNETLRKRFTCVIVYPFVQRDSRTSVADYASLRLCRPTASIRLCTHHASFGAT